MKILKGLELTLLTGIKGLKNIAMKIFRMANFTLMRKERKDLMQLIVMNANLGRVLLVVTHVELPVRLLPAIVRACIAEVALEVLVTVQGQLELDRVVAAVQKVLEEKEQINAPILQKLIHLTLKSTSLEFPATAMKKTSDDCLESTEAFVKL